MVCECVCACVRACVRVCVCVHLNVYTHTHIYIYIYIYSSILELLQLLVHIYIYIYISHPRCTYLFGVFIPPVCAFSCTFRLTHVSSSHYLLSRVSPTQDACAIRVLLFLLPSSRWNPQRCEADSCRLLHPKEVMAAMNLHRHSENLSSRGAMKGRKQSRLASLTIQ